MKGLYFSISFFILAIGVSYAYAEEVTIDLPFEHQGKDCIDLSNGTMKKYACVFIAEEEETTPLVPPTGSTTTEEEVEKEPETDPLLRTLEEYIEKNERYVDNLREKQSKGKADNVESQTIEAFNNLKLCTRGVNESQPIQNYEAYVITWHELPDLKSIDLKQTDKLTNLIKKGLECKYQWTILHPIILGDRYYHLSIENAKERITYHGQIAEGLEVFPSQERGSLKSEAIKAERKGICENTAFSVSYRVDYGCNNIYDYPEWEGKQDPIQDSQHEYYTPMMKLREWHLTNGYPDLKEYREKNKDDVNVHTLANSLGVDPEALNKFLESQR